MSPRLRIRRAPGLAGFRAFRVAGLGAFQVAGLRVESVAGLIGIRTVHAIAVLGATAWLFEAQNRTRPALQRSDSLDIE